VEFTDRTTSCVRNHACVRATVSECLEAVPRTCHNALEYLHLGTYGTHLQEQRVSCTQVSRHVSSIIKALRSGVRTTAQGQRFATTATYCQHITSVATIGHHHRIGNALAQQRQSKCGTTLDLLSSTDKTLTPTTLQLQFSCAECWVARLHCQGTSVGAENLRRVVYVRV
jgi:hypothetical protein